MDEAARREWRDLAECLYRLRHVDVTGFHSEAETNGAPGRLADAVADLVAAAGGAWTPGVSAGLMALPQASKMDRAHPTSAPFGTASTSYVRALRHALLISTGGAEGIHPSEREWLRRAVGAMPEHAHLAAGIPGGTPGGSDGDGGRPTAVRFAFAWRPRRGKGPMVLDEAVSGLRHVAGDEAPVVARLKPDGGDWFALRTVDGVLHRPVFSPGSWEPCTVAAFADASAGSVAWVDNPFLPAPAWDASVAAPSDVAVRGVAAKDDGEREAASRACIVRAGGLVAVDGIVHRPCPEPTLHLSMRRLPGPGRDVTANSLRPAWSMGDIDAFTCQSPDRCLPPVKVCDALAGLDRGDGFRDDMDRKDAWNVRTTDLGLGLGDSAALGDLMEAAGAAIADTRFWALSRPFVRATPCVRDVDPVRFPPDPVALPKALARHAGAAGAPWSDVASALAAPGGAGNLAPGLREVAEAERWGGSQGFRPRASYVVHLDATGHDELGRAGIKALGRAVATVLERAPEVEADPDAMVAFAP